MGNTEERKVGNPIPYNTVQMGKTSIKSLGNNMKHNQGNV